MKRQLILLYLFPVYLLHLHHIAWSNDFPEFTNRLNDFESSVSKRADVPLRKKILALATNYERALENAMAKSTGSEATALEEERKRLETLTEALPTTPVKKVSLNPLPEATPKGVTALRTTWNRAVANYQKSYDIEVSRLSHAFARSLEQYETELKRSRKNEQAEIVASYREKLLANPAEPVFTFTNYRIAGRYRPLPWESDTPFPLKRIERPNEPCRLVAWRVDGQPIDSAKFTNLVGDTPDSLGELVDFGAGNPGFDHVRFSLIGITAEGELRSFKNRERLPKEAGFVHVDGHFRTFAGLRQDGSCKVINFGADGDQVKSMKEIESEGPFVDVRCSGEHLITLNENGHLVARGLQDRWKRTFIQGGVQGNSVAIDTDEVNNIVIKKDGDSFVRIRMRDNSTVPIPQSSRIFLHHYSNSDGSDINTFVTLRDSLDLSKLGGAAPKNVNMVQQWNSLRQDNVYAIAALREGLGTWRFWGDLLDFAEIDFDYCTTKAGGCRKIAMFLPYIIGLKPVDNITDSDWAGAAKQTSDSSEVVPLPQFSKMFPLPVKMRPSTAGRLEVYRRDGKPVGKQADDTPLHTFPADMGNQVVDISIGDWDSHKGPQQTAVALLQDGTVRVWRANTKEAPVDPSLSGIKNIVQVKGGIRRVCLLNEKGEVFHLGEPGDPKFALSPKKIETAEPVVNIAGEWNQLYIQTQSGRIQHLFSKEWNPAEIIPVVTMVGHHGCKTLGVDGRWRSWTEDGELKGTSPPMQKIPSFYQAAGDKMHFIDADGKGRTLRNDAECVRPASITNKLQLNDPEVIKYFSTSGLEIIQLPDNRWHILNGEGDHSYMNKKIQGASKIAASKRYVFCIRPVGK